MNLEPWKDEACGAWLGRVRTRFGSIPRVGLPEFADDRDAAIEQGYVPLLLGTGPDAPVTERVSPGTLVANRQRFVALGVPGAGKSTLVAWLAWGLTRRPPWGEFGAGRPLPLPIVLRELRLDPDLGGWDALRRLVAGDMADKLDEYGRVGQLVILVDGLDEVAHVPTRRAVVAALREAAARYPEAGIVVTSRLVGYEEAPLDPTGEPAGAALASTATATASDAGAAVAAVSAGLAAAGDAGAGPAVSAGSGAVIEAESRTAAAGTTGATSDWSAGPASKEGLTLLGRLVRDWLGEPERLFAVYQVQPLAPPDVEAFVTRWYAARSTDNAAAGAAAKRLVDALVANPALGTLASRPSLLSLMCVVHRAYGQLPAGRVRLFEKISEAYLESVDRAYGVAGPSQSLEVRKRWLARIATRMQEARVAAERGEGGSGGTMLPRTAVIAALCADDLEATGAEAFLAWALQRSGLLLPAGGDELTFAHLSLQEYFAAWALVEELGAWFEPDLPVRARERLRAWAPLTATRETLVLVFELVAARGERAAQALFRELFGAGPPPDSPAFSLMAALSEDAATGVGAAARGAMDAEVRRLVGERLPLPGWCRDARALTGLQDVWLTVEAQDFDWTGAHAVGLRSVASVKAPIPLATLGTQPRLVALALIVRSDADVRDVGRFPNLGSLTLWNQQGSRLDAALIPPLPLFSLYLHGAFDHAVDRAAAQEGLEGFGVWLDGGPLDLASLHGVVEAALFVDAPSQGPITLPPAIRTLKLYGADTAALSAVGASATLERLEVHFGKSADLTPLARHPNLLRVEWSGEPVARPPGATWTLLVHGVEMTAG